jgi:hypothetical protein
MQTEGRKRGDKGQTEGRQRAGRGQTEGRQRADRGQTEGRQRADRGLTEGRQRADSRQQHARQAEHQLNISQQLHNTQHKCYPEMPSLRVVLEQIIPSNPYIEGST